MGRETEIEREKSSQRNFQSAKVKQRETKEPSAFSFVPKSHLFISKTVNVFIFFFIFYFVTAPAVDASCDSVWSFVTLAEVWKKKGWEAVEDGVAEDAAEPAGEKQVRPDTTAPASGSDVSWRRLQPPGLGTR